MKVLISVFVNSYNNHKWRLVYEQIMNDNLYLFYISFILPQQEQEKL